MSVLPPRVQVGPGTAVLLLGFEQEYEREREKKSGNKRGYEESDDEKSVSESALARLPSGPKDRSTHELLASGFAVDSVIKQPKKWRQQRPHDELVTRSFNARTTREASNARSPSNSGALSCSAARRALTNSLPSVIGLTHGDPSGWERIRENAWGILRPHPFLNRKLSLPN